MVNFGSFTGFPPSGLGQRLGIPRKEAETIIEKYFATYPGVKAYMEDTVKRARDCGYVETMTGRRRYLRDINSSNWTVRNGAERMAINTPIQGTAADMIKLAMIRVATAIKKENLRSNMLLQVHDELVFDVYRDEHLLVQPLVEQHMREALPLKVPVVVETGVGQNWLDAPLGLVQVHQGHHRPNKASRPLPAKDRHGRPVKPVTAYFLERVNVTVQHLIHR